MKGIIFKEDMFRAIIDGTKTQTRRLGGLEAVNITEPSNEYGVFKFLGIAENPDVVKMKKGEPDCDKDGEYKLTIWKGLYAEFEGFSGEFECCFLKPRYQKGEILYLKEPYHLIRKYPNAQEEPNCKIYVPEYAFDKAEHIQKLKIWKNKLYMPARYARYFIKITNIRVERLNQITVLDAHSEGFEGIVPFQNTWITIHGWSSLKANPWVWVYEFELVITIKPHNESKNT
jgi:hypothetical protein